MRTLLCRCSLSFAMVAGVCFLLLVSLVIEAFLKAFSHTVSTAVPGGSTFAFAIYFVFDFAVVGFLYILPTYHHRRIGSKPCRSTR